MPIPLSADAVAAAIQGRFGRPCRYLPSVDSTNSYALVWAAEEGAGEGAIVTTDHQTAGRGRRGRTWFDEPGTSVLFSLVLRPRLPFEGLGLLPVALGTAVAEALRSYGIDGRTKWPNDVTVNDRKIAGILVETKLIGSRVDIAVAGIGLNHDWSGVEVPSGLTDVATSLGREAPGVLPERPDVLARILLAIEELYPLVVDGSRVSELLDRARSLSSVLGRRIAIRTADGTLVGGIARDLMPDGGLKVDAERGSRVFHVGEIEQLRPIPGPSD